MRDPDHEHPDICPYPACIIYYITSFYFTKEGSHYKYGKK